MRHTLIARPRTVRLHPGSEGATAGFTLLELLVGISILALVLVSTGAVGGAAVGVYGVAATRSDVDTRTRRALERVSEELAVADSAVLMPSPAGPQGTSSLMFRKVVGQTNGVADLGPFISLAFALADGELDNGLDDDGDGLIDEHVLTLTRDPGGPAERRVVLCSDVREFLGNESKNGLDDNGNGWLDEPGFIIQQTGSALAIFLTVETPMADGELLSKTLQTTVRMRNYQP